MPDPTVTAIVERTGDAASVAWAHEGTGDLASLPNPAAAIAAAAQLGNVKALQSVTAPKDLRKAAAAALHKLKSKGLKIEEVVAPRAFSLGKEGFDLPSRAFLGLPDLEGDMELLVTTSDAGGNCALALILGGGRVKEMRHAHLGRGELRDVWKQAEGRQDLTEIPFLTGLHYAEKFAATSEHKHDWTHFLEHVPAPTLQQAKALDPLATARAAIDEGEDPNPRWLAPLGTLDDGALRHGINAMITVARTAVDDATRDAELEALYVQTADNALEHGDRTALVRSAELAADALVFHGRPRGAAVVRAQAEAAANGAPGSAIDGVLTGVKFLLISQAQGQLQERIQELNGQIGGAGPEESAE